MGKLDGKVALITGAARGQGRSHAVRLAEEGADIIAIDLCDQIESADHTMGTAEDLRETALLVEKLDRRVVTATADVRDRASIESAISAGVAELGRLDTVSINAGIASFARTIDIDEQAWRDVLDVNLTGAWLTAKAAIPHIQAGGNGGSVIFTSSAAGIRGQGNLGHYVASKHGVLGLVKSLAIEHGPEFIRINAVCPGNVDTEMLVNETILKLFMPHLDAPTRADAEQPGSGYVAANLLPIPWLDPVDISNAVLFLASDEARYITGVALPVDAGYLVK
jgi:SDR family mycofactocin-dependent oxidoreductase